MLRALELRKSGLFWLWLPALLIAIDQATKYWVTTHLSFFEPYEVLPFLNLTLAYNTGAAFSFLHSASGWQNWLFSGLAVVVSASIIVWLSKLAANAYWVSIALCLILTGSIGNLWDRILHGYVIDFLDFHVNGWHFAIFNIADSAICVGAAMLMLNWFKATPPLKS